MNTKELMLGDLVNYRPGWINEETGKPEYEFESMFPVRVIFITPDAVQYDENMPDDSIITIEAADYELFPIPLTPEFLEKNGFVACQFWHEYKDGNITIQACIPSIRMKNGPCELEIKEGVHYVHQLQQLFRLCGIEKEIEL